MIIRIPELVRVPYMLPPLPERLWTEQPGAESEWLSVDVLGASAEVKTVTHDNAVSALKVEKAAAMVPMGQSIVRLRDYQAEAVEAVFKAWESGKKAPLIVAATGCHAKGQDILMFNGSVKSVESILPGDQLMGPDGTPRTVLTLCRGKGRMVTVIPGDRFQRAGRKPWVVNEDHVLTLQWSRYSPTSWMLVDRKVSTVFSIHPLNRSSALLAMVYADSSDPKDRSRWQLDYDFELEYTGTTEDYYGFTLDGDRRYLLDDGTVTHNSGKTILAAEIMRRSVEPHLWKRALFIAHRKELLDQTVAKAKLVAPRCTVGLVQAETNELERRITVASVQTLAARKGERLAQVMGHQPPRLVVIDEAHHATSPTWVRVLDQIRAANPDVLFLGLTATPGRADGTGLDEVFDCVAYEKNLFDLVRDGYLVPPRGIRVNLDISLDSVDSKNGDFVESQLAQVINQPSVRRATVRAWQEHGHDRKMIVFCCNVQHARDLAQEFSDAGYPAASIDGSMKPKERSAVYERFRSGRLKLLCSVEVLTEGWDEPSAEGVIFARPTASQSLYSQALGRGLRLFPGKTECLVIDLVGNSDRHSPVQLASLAGLRPIENENLPAEGREAEEPDEVGEAHVDHMRAREFDFQMRAKKSRYAWRETTYGWTLQIPRVGYFLVAWHDTDKSRATVRFHDLREGRRDSAPIEVVKTPLDFDMAYGLVEGEVERLTAPRAKRPQDEAQTPPAFAFLYEDGLEEDIFVAEQILLNDADWRAKSMTPKQGDALRKLGVKDKSLPQTAGEAADLITVMNVEFDVKMREPATDKQMWYLRANKIPHERGLTKNAAKRLILAHRAQNGSAR